MKTKRKFDMVFIHPPEEIPNERKYKQKIRHIFKRIGTGLMKDSSVLVRVSMKVLVGWKVLPAYWIYKRACIIVNGKPIYTKWRNSSHVFYNRVR
jgi:hypothetical protein